jgi:hypothetical protein
MKNNFWGLIWSSFSVIQTFWLGLLGFVASLLAWAFAGQTPIPLVVLFVIITIAILVIATLIRALQTALEEYQRVKQNIIPTILRVQKDANNNIQCLLEASNLFAAQLMISFYYTDEDGFEVLIGEGFVKNVQSDQKIQTVLDQPEAGYQNVLDRLANNDLKIIQRIKVKPSIYKK